MIRLFVEFISGETSRIYYSAVSIGAEKDAYAAAYAEADRLGFIVDETRTEITIGERMGLAYLYVVGQKGIEKLHADIVAQDGMCVSTDTTREDHLIVAFSDLLRSYGIHHTLLDEAAHAHRRAAWRLYEPCEEDHQLADDLFNLMDTIAPEGYWFGAQEGDAASFGFWCRQAYARHAEVLARVGGEIVPYTWPGGYPVIYWHQAHESSEIFPLCAGCTEANELDGLAWGTIFEIESGDLYDHDLPCDQCGQQLAAYYEEGD